MPNRYAPDDVRKSYSGIVVGIGGPPHVGKSVLSEALHNQLLVHMPNGAFLQRTAPDGEGKWFPGMNDRDHAHDLRLQHKGRFTPEFLQHILGGLENLARARRIVLADLGGLLTPENAQILSRSTHLILLCPIGAEAEEREWVQFATDQRCETMAVLHSRLSRQPNGELDDSSSSLLNLQDYPVTGELWNLDRDAPPTPYKEAVAAFAGWLFKQFSSGAQ